MSSASAAQPQSVLPRSSSLAAALSAGGQGVARGGAIRIPGEKHVFLSYQWDVQSSVIEVKKLLNDRNVKCWMDIDGGMKASV